IVVPAPFAWIARNGDEQPAVRIQEPLDRAQRARVVFDVLEHVPQHDRVPRSGPVRKRLLAHGDARIRREARSRLANGGIGKIDRHPPPVAAGKVRADVTPAAADFEEWSNEAVLLDEPIEAVQHVILERDEIRHARGPPGATAGGYLTVSLLWPNSTRRDSSSATTGFVFSFFAISYARCTAGRARMSAFQRLRCGNSSMFWPCAPGCGRGQL